jgi:hypothetical protein
MNNKLIWLNAIGGAMLFSLFIARKIFLAAILPVTAPPFIVCSPAKYKLPTVSISLPAIVVY